MLNASSHRSHSRRAFGSLLGLILIGNAWMVPCGFSSSVDMSDKQELRVITYNLFLGRFWPEDAALAEKAREQGQFAERLALELSLYDPDIITFSEAPDETVVADVARRLGMNHVSFSTPTYFPGALLTRFEIIDAQDIPLRDGERPSDLFTRHWGKATVRLPDDSRLIVHSAHLYPRASEADVRMREVRAMHESIIEDIEAGRSVLLTGDLNHRPGAPEQEYLFEGGWIDTFAEAGVGTGMTARPDEPSRRIDYILAVGPIADRVVEARVLHEGSFRAHPADPESFALSDHLPVFAVFDLTR